MTQTATRAASITVAICTRDRTRQLQRALHSVTTAQTLPPAEVLVIDNRPSTDECRRLVEQEFVGVRYLREDLPGIGFARERALAEATAPFVAFIDDDAVADPGWLLAVRDALSRPNACACTGLVEPLALETEAQRLFEANGGFARGTQRVQLSRRVVQRLRGRRVPAIVMAVSMGSGCNMAVDRAAALAAGGFDGTFGSDPLLPGGEDLDLIWRLVCSGRTVVYEPRARVLHEHRREMADLARQLVNHQRGMVGCLTKAAFGAHGRERAAVWLFLAWRLCKPWWRLLKRAVGRDPLPARVLAPQCWAAASAPFAYVVVRRRLAAARLLAEEAKRA